VLLFYVSKGVVFSKVKMKFDIKSDELNESHLKRREMFAKRMTRVFGLGTKVCCSLFCCIYDPTNKTK
jgi:hypothetical protein